MSSLESGKCTTVGAKNSDIAEIEDKELKMNKILKEISENANK